MDSDDNSSSYRGRWDIWVFPNKDNERQILLSIITLIEFNISFQGFVWTQSLLESIRCLPHSIYSEAAKLIVTKFDKNVNGLWIPLHGAIWCSA